MEGVGARLGRSSTRYGGPAAVFTGPVRKWKKKWVHVSPSSKANNSSSNHHGNSNAGASAINGNSVSHLLLYKWTPLSQSHNKSNGGGNGNNNSSGEDSGVEEPPRRKFKYIPVAVLEEQNRETTESEDAEKADEDNKENNTGTSTLDSAEERDGNDEKPDINDVPTEGKEEDKNLVRQDLNESTLDLSLGLNTHEGDPERDQSKNGPSES